MVTALTLPFGHYCLSERSPHFLTLLQLLLIRGAMISLSYIARTSASKLHPDQACIFIFLPLFSRFILAPPPLLSRKTRSIKPKRKVYLFSWSCELIDYSDYSRQLDSRTNHFRSKIIRITCDPVYERFIYRMRSKVIFLFQN